MLPRLLSHFASLMEVKKSLLISALLSLSGNGDNDTFYFKSHFLLLLGVGVFPVLRPYLRAARRQLKPA